MMGINWIVQFCRPENIRYPLHFQLLDRSFGPDWIQHRVCSVEEDGVTQSKSNVQTRPISIEYRFSGYRVLHQPCHLLVFRAVDDALARGQLNSGIIMMLSDPHPLHGRANDDKPHCSQYITPYARLHADQPGEQQDSRQRHGVQTQPIQAKNLLDPEESSDYRQ